MISFARIKLYSDFCSRQTFGAGKLELRGGYMKSIVIVLALVSVAVFPLGARAETLFKRQHGEWKSYALLSDNMDAARMSTQGIDDPEGTLLIVDNYPGACAGPILQIVSCQEEFKDNAYDGKGIGSIRVDARNAFEVEYLIFVKNSCLIIAPITRSLPTILKELMTGAFVSFKINLLMSKDSESIYKRYSLAGFTEAQMRTLKLCQEIEEMRLGGRQKNNSDYFEERRTPEAAPRP